MKRPHRPAVFAGALLALAVLLLAETVVVKVQTTSLRKEPKFYARRGRRPQGRGLPDEARPPRTAGSRSRPPRASSAGSIRAPSRRRSST